MIQKGYLDKIKMYPQYHLEKSDILISSDWQQYNILILFIKVDNMLDCV